MRWNSYASMKSMLVIAAVITSFATARADDAGGFEVQTSESICAARVIQAYLPVIDQPHVYDKYKHCAMSCVISLNCGPAEAWTAAVGKEVKDALTHVIPSKHRGDPSMKDLEADGVGIKFVARGYARSAQDCYAACHKFFPMPAEGPGI